MSWITPPTLTFGSGYGRPTTILPPLGYRAAAGKTYPLVVMLANYGATGLSLISRFNMTEAVSYDDGAFICFPDALPNSASFLQWDYWLSGSGTDLDYIINGLIIPIKIACPIDPKRVFLVGYSDGAFMSHQVAVNRPDLITSGFTCSGCNGTADPTGSLGKSIPWVHWHGAVDATVLYGGDPSGTTLPGDLGGHGYVSATGTAAIHAKWNGVVGTLQSAYDSIDFVTAVTGSETFRMAYSNTTTNTAVEHWVGIGVDHAISLTGTKNMGQILYQWMINNHRST